MLGSTRCSLYFTEAQDPGRVHTRIFAAASFISTTLTVKPQWEVFPQPFPREATEI